MEGEREEVLGVEADHVNMCKFESEDSELYFPIASKVQRLARDAVQEARVQPSSRQCHCHSISEATFEMMARDFGRRRLVSN